MPQDDKAALKWYRLAAKQGDANAQSSLGVMYATGQGVAQDDQEAVRLFRLSAEQGNPSGQCNLRNMIEKGRGEAVATATNQPPKD